MELNTKNDDQVPFKCRTILWYLVFFGFSINYCIRITINIALIDMIDAGFGKLSNNSIIESECFAKNLENFSKITENSIDFSLKEDIKRFPSLERKLLDALGINYERNGFKWGSKEQGLVLGSFFWFHFLLQLPGGILAVKYGTKVIFGYANLIGCLLCCLMPIASYLDYNLMICLRVLQGIITSLSWPSMHHLTGQWIPADERSSFVSSYLGSSMGVAVSFKESDREFLTNVLRLQLFYPIFGWIMKQFSWEYIFHFCGLVGVIWFLCWNYFVYDTPSVHPRIDPIERNYIHEKIGSSLNLNETEVKRIIPWKAIFKSKSLWINTIAQFGGIWGLFTLLTQGPSYFRFVHGWSSTKVGIFSGLPHLLRTVVAIVVSNIADYMLKTNKMSNDNVRKVGTTICCTINGLFVLSLAFAGCNGTLACVFIVLATGCHGAVSTGPLASIIDNSPNYAGVLLGIVNMFCVIPGFISPIIVSYLTHENQSVESWQMVFLICSFMLITSGIIYVLFSDSSRQEWNKYTPKKSEMNSEIYRPIEDQEMLKT